MRAISNLDLIVLFAYLALMAGIGFYLMHYMRGARDYFAGGNRIPWWVSGISFYMSSFSAWTFSGAAGFVYHTGLFALIYFATWSLSAYIGYHLTATRWRRSRVISPVEYTRIRYNRTTQQLLGWVTCVSGVLSMGIHLTAVSKIIGSTLNLPVEWVIVVVGIIVLLYTFLGGVWAVMITDVVQFVILIAITLLVTPLSVHLIGGLGKLLESLPPLKFQHVYNNFPYDVHYLLAIILLNIFSLASQGAQRFYSVRDERAARRAGLLCSLLFLTVPILFGIPPLVARVLWPDLSQVAFFQRVFQPNDVVYIAVCLEILPPGLMGIFLAAMFAATMSAMDSIYNILSSIISRDIYQGIFKPQASSREMLVVGRLATLAIGILVIILALNYVRSPLGIFNLMVIVMGLFSLPMSIPSVLGLIFQHLSRWSAVASISWGILMNFVARYLLHWTFGPQVYASIILSLTILLLSPLLGQLYRKRRFLLGILSIGWGIATLIFFGHTGDITGGIESFMAGVAAFAFGSSLYLFSRLFARETEGERAEVRQFFQKLATSVDVYREVYATGQREVSSFSLVGVLTSGIGALIPLLLLSSATRPAWPFYLTLSGLLFGIGFLLFYFGRRAERLWAHRLTDTS